MERNPQPGSRARTGFTVCCSGQLGGVGGSLLTSFRVGRQDPYPGHTGPPCPGSEHLGGGQQRGLCREDWIPAWTALAAGG